MRGELPYKRPTRHGFSSNSQIGMSHATDPLTYPLIVQFIDYNYCNNNSFLFSVLFFPQLRKKTNISINKIKNNRFSLYIL